MNRRQKWRARKQAQRHISLDGAECSRCGTTDGLQRHHPDHAKPLEIVIVCQTCHAVLEGNGWGWRARWAA